MSVAQFLARLPAARRKELARVRAVVRKNLPTSYEETAANGFIVWQVPLRRYPDTYNGHPLHLAALAPQKIIATMPVDKWAGIAKSARRRRT